MLAMTISLLFALAAVAALTVIHRSLLVGSARARLILAELTELDRYSRVTREPAEARFQPALAVA